MPEVENTQKSKHKITLLGAYKAGKTSLLVRFAGEPFAINHMPTVGVDYKCKRVVVADKEVRLQIWDSAGQERFRAIAPNYFKGSKGIVVVYDVTDRESFDRARWWLSELRTTFKSASDQMDLVLVGNKTDLGGERVSEEEGRQTAAEFSTAYWDVSAKLELTDENSNVQNVFQDLAERIVARLATSVPAGAAPQPESILPYGSKPDGRHSQSAVGVEQKPKRKGFMCCGGPPT